MTTATPITALDIAKAAPSTTPLATTFELLSTDQIIGAIRAAATEIARRTDHDAVADNLNAILNETDDLETLLQGLPPLRPSAIIATAHPFGAGQ